MHKKTSLHLVFFFIFSLMITNIFALSNKLINAEDLKKMGKNLNLNNLPTDTGTRFNPVEYASFKGYKGDGPFIENTAYAGDTFGYCIAVVPADVIYFPFGSIFNYPKTGDAVAGAILIGSTKIFGCIFGGPALGLERVFYTFPRWMFGIKSSSIPAQNQESIIKTSHTPPVPVTPYSKQNAKKTYVPTDNILMAKPSLLKKNEIVPKINDYRYTKPVISKPINTKTDKNSTSTVTPLPSRTTSVLNKKSLTQKKNINNEETSWNSPPPLPDWIKNEIVKSDTEKAIKPINKETINSESKKSSNSVNNITPVLKQTTKSQKEIKQKVKVQDKEEITLPKSKVAQPKKEEAIPEKTISITKSNKTIEPGSKNDNSSSSVYIPEQDSNSKQ